MDIDEEILFFLVRSVDAVIILFVICITLVLIFISLIAFILIIESIYRLFVDKCNKSTWGLIGFIIWCTIICVYVSIAAYGSVRIVMKLFNKFI